jgi:hypothetical protein
MRQTLQWWADLRRRRRMPAVRRLHEEAGGLFNGTQGQGGESAFFDRTGGDKFGGAFAPGWTL